MREAWKGLIGRLAVAAVVIAGTGAVAAQDYPSRPVRLIVPSPPGGGTDAMARLLSNRLGETVQWQFVVDNRAGAGGNIGMDAAARALPDGYTLVMGESANLTINQFLYASMPFDPARDLAPVALVATVPLVLVVPPSRPYTSVAELIAHARRGGAQAPLTFASGGNGTVGHLTGEIFMRRVGITLQHVPYRGGAAAVTDVMAGHVDLHFASLPAATAQIEGGQLRALRSRRPSACRNCRTCRP
jgi:tripartite-type tricarboxylate transporter receptor subunit TctC